MHRHAHVLIPVACNMLLIPLTHSVDLNCLSCQQMYAHTGLHYSLTHVHCAVQYPRHVHKTTQDNTCTLPCCAVQLATARCHTYTRLLSTGAVSSGQCQMTGRKVRKLRFPRLGLTMKPSADGPLSLFLQLSHRPLK